MNAAPPQGDPVARAFSAYFRTSGENAAIPNSGSDMYEHNGKHYVVLWNVNGVLAVYRVRNNGALKRLRRWPAEMEDW
jgi:hypothetical protein